MAEPRILYDLSSHSNLSFETGTVGAEPDDWTETYPNAGDQAVIATDQFHDRGSSEGSRSLRLFQNGASAVTLHQNATWHPPLNVTVTLMGMARAINPGDQFEVRLYELNGAALLSFASATISPPTGSFEKFEVSKTLSEATGDGIRIQLMGGGNGHDVRIDYLHLGRDLNFPTTELRDLRADRDSRSVVNIGAGAYEAVSDGDPFSRVRCRLSVLTEDGVFEGRWRDFLGYTKGHRRFAFWRDRDLHANRYHHFSVCFLREQSFSQNYGAGPLRYNATLEFVAPVEWVQQEVV